VAVAAVAPVRRGGSGLPPAARRRLVLSAWLRRRVGREAKRKEVESREREEAEGEGATGVPPAGEAP
jgi:hypothetical protein